MRIWGKTFDLGRPGGLEEFIHAVEDRIRDHERTTKAAKPQGGAKTTSRRSSEPEGRHVLELMKALARTAQQDPSRRPEAIRQIQEIGRALILKTRYPIPHTIDLLQAPFVYYDLMHNPVCKGTREASDLPADAARGADSSRLDPLPSSFWTRPSDIPSHDLYNAFGPPLTLGSNPCTYDEPKSSYGTSPGFTVKCGEKVIKVKFGETENSKRNSEVAVTRLFGALGYHVEPNDYAPEVRVRYDRRIFLEFNDRKPLNIRITALGFIPVHVHKVQTTEDPFHYIRSAITRSGNVLSSEQVEERLIRPDVIERAKRSKKRIAPGSSPADFRDDAEKAEKELDYLVMEEANVQLKDSGGRNIGPWDWNDLDHPSRRELRGAGLLAAWTNYFDCRWDNNRLKLVEDAPPGSMEGGPPPTSRAALSGKSSAGVPLHFISDLGNSLGRAESFKVDAQGLVNDFPWTFTAGPAGDAKGRTQKRFRIVGYQPIVDNEAFRDMTVDDARWMARLIAQLTENQMKQALIATGYTSAEVRLYTEKLISRRDAMVRDLGLEDEIALLRPNRIDRMFSYDPKVDGPMTARAGDGSELHPTESRDLVVRRGAVEPR